MGITKYLALGSIAGALVFTSCATDDETVKARPTPAPRVVKRHTTYQTVAKKPNRRGPSPYEMEVVNSYDPQ